MNSQIKKPAATALANGLDTSKQNFFRLNYSRSLPFPASIEQEMHWRKQLDQPHSQLILVCEAIAKNVFEQTSDRYAVLKKLDRDEIPEAHAWPCEGLPVAVMLSDNTSHMCNRWVAALFNCGASGIELQVHNGAFWNEPTLYANAKLRVAA